MEGEGSFNVSLRKNGDYRVGWQVVLSFNVSQRDKTVLLLIKEHLGCGIIKQRSVDNLYSLDVTNPGEIITKVIPFFERYRFISPTKEYNFSLFKKMSTLVSKGKHLSKEGLREILLLREKINEGKGRKRKYSIHDVFSEISSETIRQAPRKFG